MGNMEGMEVFKYSEGDSHKVHHEFYSSFVSEFWGSRAVSAMLFLSDVEEGGDTVFDQLNIRK